MYRRYAQKSGNTVTWGGLLLNIKVLRVTGAKVTAGNAW